MEMLDYEIAVKRFPCIEGLLAQESKIFEAEVKSVFSNALVVIAGPWVRYGWWGETIEPGVLFNSEIIPEFLIENVNSEAFVHSVWSSFQILSSFLHGGMWYVEIVIMSQVKKLVALIPEDGSLRSASSSISILLADCVGLVPSTEILLDFGGARDLVDGRLTLSDDSIVRSNPVRAFEFFFLASQIRSLVSQESVQVISDVFENTPLDMLLRDSIGTWINRIIQFSLTPSLGMDLIRLTKLRYRLFPMLAEIPINERSSRWRIMMQILDRAAVHIRINKIDDLRLSESILYVCFLEPLWRQEFSYISQVVKSKSKIMNFLLSVESSSGLKFSEMEIIRDGILYIRVVKTLLLKANLLIREYTPPRIAKSRSGESARGVLDRATMISAGMIQGQEWIVKSRASIQHLFPHLEECFGLSDLLKGEYLGSEDL
jgi:hypothetical protein